MTFRVLADENVDQRVVHRLDHYGHDVEHVDFVSDLGKERATTGSLAIRSPKTA